MSSLIKSALVVTICFECTRTHQVKFHKNNFGISILLMLHQILLLYIERMSEVKLMFISFQTQYYLYTYQKSLSILFFSSCDSSSANVIIINVLQHIHDILAKPIIDILMELRRVGRLETSRLEISRIYYFFRIVSSMF